MQVGEDFQVGGEFLVIGPYTRFQMLYIIRLECWIRPMRPTNLVGLVRVFSLFKDLE